MKILRQMLHNSSIRTKQESIIDTSVWLFNITQKIKNDEKVYYLLLLLLTALCLYSQKWDSLKYFNVYMFIASITIESDQNVLRPMIVYVVIFVVLFCFFLETDL